MYKSKNNFNLSKYLILLVPFIGDLNQKVIMLNMYHKYVPGLMYIIYIYHTNW